MSWIKDGSNFTDEETVYFTYNLYGTGGNNALNNGGLYQVVNSTPSSNGEVQLNFTSGTQLSNVNKFSIYDTDVNGTDYTQLLELIYNNYPDSLLTIKKEGSDLSNVYRIGWFYYKVQITFNLIVLPLLPLQHKL